MSTTQAELLRHAVEVLEDQEMVYMVVGSLASMAYGEPRLTRDIDVVLDLKPNQIDAICAAFPPPDYYLSRDAMVQAVRDGGQFNLIHPASGNKIDFILPRRNAWGQEQLRRRRRILLQPGQHGYTASPEDVILGKLWYYQEGHSEKHLRDVAAILQVSGDQLDRPYIDHWAAELGLREPWLAVLKRLQWY